MDFDNAQLPLESASQTSSMRPRSHRTPRSGHVPERIDAPADAVITLDSDLRIIGWNRAAARLYEIPTAAALGQPFARTITCRAAMSATVPERTALSSIGLRSGRCTHVLPTGREIPVYVSLVSLGSGRGDSERRHLVIVSDDSEHLRMSTSTGEWLKFEMLLSELSTRFSALPEDQVDGEIELWLRRLVHALEVDRSSFAELTPEGIAVTHSYALPGIETYPLGIAQAALPWLMREFSAGRSVVLSRIPDDLPEDAVEERQLFLAAGMTAGIGIPISIAGSLICVLTFGTSRGPRSWPKHVISRLHLAGDAFGNALVRRQSKQRLDQKQQELTHVGRVATIGELAAVIAHELDQPLTAVVSNAEAVRFMLQSEHPDLAEADAALKDVVDSAMRAAEIIRRERRLLRKSRLSFERLDLNEAVREIELFLRAEARQAGVTIAFELLPGLPTVNGDRIQLQQVILNLARNGVQAMSPQPTENRFLTIRTAANNAEVTLSVSDSGPPVDAAWFDRMFEPFFTTKLNGLGMGLAISKSILDAHRGRIWPTRSEDRGGVTMHFAIPRRK